MLYNNPRKYQNLDKCLRNTVVYFTAQRNTVSPWKEFPHFPVLYHEKVGIGTRRNTHRKDIKHLLLYPISICSKDFPKIKEKYQYL